MEAGEKRSLLDEIVELTAIPQPQEGDFTSMEYAQRAIPPCSEPTARRRLCGLVKDGVLITLKVMGPNGVKIRVYRKPSTCAEV